MERVRYLNKDVNANERNNFSLWWKEQIEHFGTSIRYYTNGYSLTSHNFIYGEDPTTAFESVGEMIMLTNITNDSIMLSKFGIMADCDMTAVVHISSFSQALGPGREPKAGDLIEMHEFGGYGDRPGFRGAPIYEITERDDQHLELTNTLMGHYVWYIKCKRWEYSYEPGMHAEPNSIQVNDGGDYGRMAGGENPEELFQPYPDSADNSAKCIYDYYDGASEAGNINLPAGHYIPAQTGNQDPHPNNALYTVENESQLQKLSSYSNDMNTIVNNGGNILLRSLETADGVNKTFTLSTSSKPEDIIKYTTDTNTFDLYSDDGGTF